MRKNLPQWRKDSFHGEENPPTTVRKINVMRNLPRWGNSKDDDNHHLPATMLVFMTLVAPWAGCSPLQCDSSKENFSWPHLGPVPSSSNSPFSSLIFRKIKILIYFPAVETLGGFFFFFFYQLFFNLSLCFIWQRLILYSSLALLLSPLSASPLLFYFLNWWLHLSLAGLLEVLAEC